MSISSDALGRVVRTIWATQLGLDVDDADLESVEELLAEREAVEITVQLSGGFRGALVQRCSRGFSLLAAAAAFSAAANDLEASDLRDALSELAHMTAGNLRSMLPGPCDVSIPTKVNHDRQAGEILASTGFTLQEEPLVVTLEQR